MEASTATFRTLSRKLSLHSFMEASTEAVEASMEVTEASTSYSHGSFHRLHGSFHNVLEASIEVVEASMKVVETSMEASTYAYEKSKKCTRVGEAQRLLMADDHGCLCCVRHCDEAP